MYNDVHWHNRHKVCSNDRLHELSGQGIITHTDNTDVVSATFWDKVYTLIWDKTPYSMDRDWIYEIGSQLVTKTGKIAKRIGKKFYTEVGYRLPDDIISEIGNLANQYRGVPMTASIDLTQDFDWKNGMFGKSGSCYWGSHVHSRDLLDSMDCYALRYYSIESPEMTRGYTHHGIGRTWILPVHGDDDNGALILMNAYGHKLEMSANILQSLLNTDDCKWSWHKIGLINDADDEPYINDDRGIILYPDALRDWAKDYDLNNPYDLDWDWDDNGYFANPRKCWHCDCRLDDDNSIYSEVDDHEYCQDCYYELFGSCHHCDQEYRMDDLTYWDDEYYCPDCIGYHAVECWQCNTLVGIDECVTDDVGDVFCQACADYHLSHCDICGENRYHDSENHLRIGSNLVCLECATTYDPDNVGMIP